MYTFKLIWTWYPLTHDLTLKRSIEMSSSVNQTMCQNLYLMQAACPIITENDFLDGVLLVSSHA